MLQYLIFNERDIHVHVYMYTRVCMRIRGWTTGQSRSRRDGNNAGEVEPFAYTHTYAFTCMFTLYTYIVRRYICI